MTHHQGYRLRFLSHMHFGAWPHCLREDFPLSLPIAVLPSFSFSSPFTPCSPIFQPTHTPICYTQNRKRNHESRQKKEEIILFTSILHINVNTSPNPYYYREETKWGRQRSRRERKEKKRRRKRKLLVPSSSFITAQYFQL